MDSNGGRRKGGIEMYDRTRYFTVTADHLDGTPMLINECTAELERLHTLFFGKPKTNQCTNSQFRQLRPIRICDEEILNRARRAANGSRFERLWRGDWRDSYPSQSEADLALCNMLAFWTGGDSDRVDSLFRRSGLMRPKWDQRHFNDGSTYGGATVARACTRGVRS